MGLATMQRTTRLTAGIPLQSDATMHFSRLGNSFRVARITGPSHNLLGIEFGNEPDSPLVTVLDTVQRNPPTGSLLLTTEVRSNVLLGVADANADFGTNYSVKRIEFVATDSPPHEIYRLLARSIVERMAKQEPFA